MKKVFVSGAFNVIHPGHMRLLRFAKQCGDKLIVGVFADKDTTQGAFVPEKLRLEGLKSNIWVDDAFLIKGSLKNVIKKLKPDVIVKGKEHETRFNEEVDILKEYGGQLIFSSGEAVFSSIDLIRREFDEFSQQSIQFPANYLKRHNVKRENLSRLVKEFSKLKVCVIGDLIVDKFIYCQPLGMSQEDHSVVVTPLDVAKYVGGAGIVSAHAAGLGAKVQFLSVVGNDEAATFVENQLRSFGVNASLFNDENRPTTIKERYLSSGKSILRVSKLYQGTISLQLQNKILKKFKLIASKCDLLIFSDFNYGCLPQTLVDKIIKIARKNKMIIVADSQSSSQIGDISRFKNIDLITPTEKEARISTKNHEDGLIVMTEQLRTVTKVKNIILKLGEEGLLVHTKDKKGKNNDDRITAMNLNAKHTSGAGDSLLVASAMVIAAKGNIWESAYLGSLAAAIQVSRVGNIPLRAKDIMQEIAKFNAKTN